jgi:glycosyltransferase involved in cell wall biosynthesis
MKEFSRLGYYSVIITSDSNKLAQVPEMDQSYIKQETDGIELWWVQTLKYHTAKSMSRILSWIDFEWRLLIMPKEALPRPDVIVISSLSLLTILNGLYLSKRYGCRLVFEIRDIWPLTITEEGGFSTYNPFVVALAWIERLGYRHADAIVGTMPNLSEHVADVLSYERSAECIPMGIDGSMLTKPLEIPEDYSAKYLPLNKFVVVHAGTIGITNALDTFLECAVSMASNEGIHFLFVGDGDLRKHYLAKYGHLPNLTFAPKVPKNMVQSILARCDLLYFSVHESKVWRFGQSLNKVIDYMLSGKPIVASYTGYPSMINEAGCGTYVAACDIPGLRSEILRYWELPKSEREAIGARGRDWILMHRNYRVLAQKYLSILFPSQD